MPRQHLIAAFAVLGASLTGPGCQVPTPTGSTASSSLAAGTTIAHLPDQVGFVALSPDRRRIFYTTTSAPTRSLFVAELGQAPTHVAEVDAGIDLPKWQGDGSALLYTQRLTRVIPGEYADWDIPRTETLGYRLMRQPLSGGAPEVLLETEDPISFEPSPTTTHVAYFVTHPNGETGPLSLWGGQGSEVLEEGARYGHIGWSPDGTRFAYSAARDFGKPAVKVMTVSGRAARTVAATEPDPQLIWAGGDRLNVLLRKHEKGGETELEVMTYAFNGEGPLKTTIDLVVPGKVQAYAGYWPSPDGTRLLSYRKAPHEIVVISIPERTVQIVGPVVSVVGWLDDTRFLHRGGEKGAGIHVSAIPPAMEGAACPPATGRAAPKLSGIPPGPTPTPHPDFVRPVARPFSYEVTERPIDAGVEHYERDGHVAKMAANQAVVTLLSPDHLDDVLSQYGLALERQYMVPAAPPPSTEGTSRQTPDCPISFNTEPIYVLHVPTAPDEDISDLQSLAENAGLEGHYHFFSKTGAVLMTKLLRMRRDHAAGIIGASMNSIGEPG